MYSKRWYDKNLFSRKYILIVMDRNLAFQILTEQDLNRFGIVQGYYLFRMEIFDPYGIWDVEVEIKMFFK